MLKIFSIFLLSVTVATALPTGGKDLRTREDKNLILDDIRYPPGFDIQSGLIGDRYRWPNRELIYEIDQAFTSEERAVLQGAMNMISSQTCMRFRQRTNEPDWVYIQKGEVNSGCWSYVGRINGRQILNLQRPESPNAPHCIWVGTAGHELIHAIGFHHEQGRYDRDDYVDIIWNNIPQDYHYAFDKYPDTVVDTFGVPYDHSSIMHYDAYAFAIDVRQPTIISKQPGRELGGDVLTEFDIQKINRMYKC